jgi:hypothetical protein
MLIRLPEYYANEDTTPLAFEDPFELSLKAKWSRNGVIVGVEAGQVEAVSDGFDLLLRWYKDPGVDTWNEELYERIFSWHRMAKEAIDGTVDRRLMFATLFTFEWYPQRGSVWLNELEILAREAR